MDSEGHTIVDYEQEHWWITGFNPYYPDVEAGNLTATYTIYFKGNEGMCEAFYNQWYGREDNNGKWVFNNYAATFIFTEGNNG